MAKDPKDEISQEDKNADTIAKAVQAAIEKALPLAMMGVAQMLKPPAVAAPLPPEFGTSDRCTKCLQFRNVCKDKHVLMVVAPANPRRFSRFPGITIGGTTYISPRPGAPIYVPKDNDIAYKLQRYEDEEDNLKEGNVQSHNSGVLSPHASREQVNQANPMGFRGMNQGSPQ